MRTKKTLGQVFDDLGQAMADKKNLDSMPYVKIRNRIKEETINAVQSVYRNDKEMLLVVSGLISVLEVSPPDKIFVMDLWGFMNWATQTKQDNRSALSTIIHDLGEFARNRKEKWFCPRTMGYSKYLSGSSGVITW